MSTRKLENLMMRAALAYASRGWDVFPCNGKIPLTEHGLKDATRDPAIIQTWWTRWPDANVALAMGGGMFAFDIDVKNGTDGRKTLAELERQHGPLPATPRQRTPSGGAHLLFKLPKGVVIPNSAGKLGPGLDTRGTGGYIVVAPSLGPDGKRYRWDATAKLWAIEIATAPQWLIKALTKPMRQRPRAAGEPPHDAYVRAAVEGELGRLAMAREGERNDALNTAAYSLGQLAGAHMLDKAWLCAELKRTGTQIGLAPAEVRSTIESGVTAGMNEPRRVPEPAHHRSTAAREAGQHMSQKAGGNTTRGGAAPANGADGKRDARTAAEDDAEIARLAKLPPLAYERERKAAAEKLGIERVSILDMLVKAMRGEAAPPGQGQPLEFPEPKPWHEPVNGAALLDATMRTMREYVILSDAQAAAVTLWSTYTHVYDAGDITPKLIVKSPLARSGKTRLAEVLQRTTSRPLLLSGISPAALLRVIERHHPTLLLDEMDATMKQDREMAEAMRGIINSGFNRGAAYCVKNVPVPDGGYEPRKFSTWCPQMFAGIGDLPETVRDRSIEIDMQRKLSTEKVKRLRERGGGDLRAIGRKAARWGADNMAALRATRPIMPPGLNDRACDAWEPLFVIADLAGGGWPQRARRAALALSGDSVIEDGNTGIMLLGDIKRTFEREATDKLFSQPLAATLGRMEERPWPEWKNGKPITTRQLAALLRQFKIKPLTIRTGTNTDKGYRLAHFLDAFERYLPPSPPLHPSQRHKWRKT